MLMIDVQYLLSIQISTVLVLMLISVFHVSFVV